MKVPFNKPAVLGGELDYIQDVIDSHALSGNGKYADKSGEWFKKRLGCVGAVPTPSCTSALEMALMLADIGPGDEVILPSYTFTSTATAIVLHGGVPVFIDSDPNQLNIDVSQIEAAITPKTKAIMPMHYAGVSCDMAAIMNIAEKHNLIVVEDAAQCVGAKDEMGAYIGSRGHLSAFSFHETKNINCGNGGMLCVNDAALWERAEIIRDKGTNRQQFFRGTVNKYSWKDKGSSYLMSELQAAYLYAQLEQEDTITQNRLSTWNFYHEKLNELEQKSKLRRPLIPECAMHNAHIYFILMPSKEESDALRGALNEKGVGAVIHYVPLHSSEAGVKFGRDASDMTNANDFSSRLIRLPLFYGITQGQKEFVIDSITDLLA